MSQPIDVRALVAPDRVHRSVYTDPAIFDLEMRHIFEGSWVYIGHESQVPARGDYATATIGRQPVMMIRHSDGTVRVLYNRCPHRGAQVVPEGQGSARLLRCAYHGWVFNTDGSVRTIPLEKGYEGSCFGRGHADADMRAAPLSGSYRGFVFASLTEDAPPLVDWLGGVASSIDNMVDRAPGGEIEAAGGVLRYLHKCNWKLFVENLNDLMHPMVAHMSSSGTARTVANGRSNPDGKVPEAIEILGPFTSNYEFFERMGVQAFPGGHSYSGGTTSIHADYSDVSDYDAAMIAAYGADRARDIYSVNRHNTVVYPSMTLKGAIQTVRVVRPITVDRTIIESHTFRLKGAPDRMLERSILYCNLINSSANLVGPDDHEAYQRLQTGLLGQGHDWVSLHRYPDADTPNADGGWVAPGTSDMVHRNQYRAWLALMERGAAREAAVRGQVAA